MAGYDLRAGARRALGAEAATAASPPTRSTPRPPRPPVDHDTSPDAASPKPVRPGGPPPPLAEAQRLPGTQRSRGSRQLNISVPAGLFDQVGEALAADPSATVGDLVLAALQRVQAPERDGHAVGPFASTPRRARRILGGARSLAFYLTHDQAKALQELAGAAQGTYSSLVTDALVAYLRQPANTTTA